MRQASKKSTENTLKSAHCPRQKPRRRRRNEGERPPLSSLRCRRQRFAGGGRRCFFLDTNGKRKRVG